MPRIPAAPIAVAAAMALLAAACGSSEDDPVVVQTTTSEMFATTTTEAPTEAPATTTEAPTEALATTTEAPAEAPSDVPESVTVEEGDSLSKIAKRYGTTVDALVRINEMCDPNQIFVGQVILLADPDAESTDEDDAGADVVIVTVQAGDSLSKIAKRHDTTVEDIMARNAIEDANLLFVGQELVIDGEVPAEDEAPEENPYC
tara:strand:- start:151 stop:759 length:609 start_codon:yes stop_codon:yes gene_type:complete